MAIELIAIDMDGTLLDPQHQITPAVKQAIAAARNLLAGALDRALSNTHNDGGEDRRDECAGHAGDDAEIERLPASARPRRRFRFAGDQQDAGRLERRVTRGRGRLAAHVSLQRKEHSR